MYISTLVFSPLSSQDLRLCVCVCVCVLCVHLCVCLVVKLTNTVSSGTVTVTGERDLHVSLGTLVCVRV